MYLEACRLNPIIPTPTLIFSRQEVEPGGTSLAKTLAEPSQLRRSYAFLIERLLPSDLLSSERSTQLQRALATGNPAQLYAETLGALRDLENLGVVTQQASFKPGGKVFQARNGDRIHLQDPGTSQQASRPQSGSTATLAHPGNGAQARPSGDQHELPAGLEVVTQETRTPTTDLDAATQMIDSLRPFLELASLKAELSNLPSNLRRVIQKVESQWAGAKVQLLCLEGASMDNLTDAAVHTVSRQDIASVPHHAEAFRTGDVSLATSAAVDAALADAPVAAVVPLRVGGEDWGLLEVTWPSPSEKSMQQQVLLMRSIATLVELAIRNQSTMEKLVFVDPLTGVYNRGFYERQVALEIERAHRTNRKFGLLVLDVDDFKQINDQYGHRAGDQVLSQLARELQSKMRKIDLLFRYGGEEFVVLLPGAEQEETERTGERLRRIIDEMTMDIENVPGDLQVTISVGAAVFPDQSRTQSGIFKAADEAMYRAKKQGKNRVAFSQA